MKVFISWSGDRSRAVADVLRRWWPKLDEQVGKQMSDESKPPAQDQLSYLWDSYKYRHGLCWKAVYKIIAGVVVLAVLPYAKPELTKPLGFWMLVPPISGTLLAFFGVFVVNNELKLFSQVVVAHGVLRKRVLERVLKECDFRKITFDDVPLNNARWQLFDIYVHFIIIFVFLLSLGNALFLGLSWIPNHAVEQRSRREGVSESWCEHRKWLPARDPVNTVVASGWKAPFPVQPLAHLVAFH